MSRFAALLLCSALGAAAVLAAPGPFRKPTAAPKEVGLADLLALPDAAWRAYRVDPYLRVAESLQAMGKARAIKLLEDSAATDEYPHNRTLVLCRMLFKARPGSAFRRAWNSGLRFGFFHDRDEWPSEPIEIVKGVPFLVAMSSLTGQAETPAHYLSYCMVECDWNTERFSPRSPEEKREAMETLISYPDLKDNVDEADRRLLEEQIR